MSAGEVKYGVEYRFYTLNENFQRSLLIGSGRCRASSLVWGAGATVSFGGRERLPLFHASQTGGLFGAFFTSLPM